MMDLRELKDIVCTRDVDERCEGCSCQYRLINGLGYKLYYNSGTRDYAFAAQLVLSAHKLAPKAYSVFDLPSDTHDRKYSYLWGYTTEHVRCLVGDVMEGIAQEWNVWDWKYHPLFNNQFKQLQQQMDKLKIMCTDTHDLNFGLDNETGELVCIDTEGVTLYK